MFSLNSGHFPFHHGVKRMYNAKETYGYTFEVDSVSNMTEKGLIPVVCAEEGEKCSCDGSIRYGVPGKWTNWTKHGGDGDEGVHCHLESFGGERPHDSDQRNVCECLSVNVSIWQQCLAAKNCNVSVLETKVHSTAAQAKHIRNGEHYHVGLGHNGEAREGNDPDAVPRFDLTTCIVRNSTRGKEYFACWPWADLQLPPLSFDDLNQIGPNIYEYPS
jgi:hypothetical protein